MSAVAMVSEDLGRSRVGPIRHAVAGPDWRHAAAGVVVVACMIVPDACIHAKAFKLSLITRLAIQRLVAPSA